MRPFLLLLTLALSVLAGLAPAWAQAERRVEIALVADAARVQPGGTVWVALRQRIDRGWHTYWRNPGDAGQATQIAWTLPPGWRAGEIRWPAPRLTMVGPLANYGYSDEVLLPVPVTAPATARVGDVVTLRAAAAWLVCEEVCIPEEGVATLRLPVVAGAPAPGRDRAAVRRWLGRVPTRFTGAAALVTTDGDLRLALAGEQLDDWAAGRARFFPYVSGVIDHAAPQPVERGSTGFTLRLTPTAQTLRPTTIAGVVTSGDRAVEVVASSGAAPPGASGLGLATAARNGGLGLPLAMGLGLLGGLLLNLMPCVFPILALKAAHLLRHREDRPAARRSGHFYAAGVLAAFLGLALAVILLQRSGEAVGWGFQLQSPVVVAVLALVMLLAALNLSGVFTVGGGVQGLGGKLAGRHGDAGGFFTGLLAVVVAAPCTAPFMAGATGWALVQGPAEALAVFLALGVGFAAPVALLSFAPRLLRVLPPPGPWTVRLQRWLAVPMYAAVAWLVWLLARQTLDAGAVWFAAMAAGVALTAWLWGRRQRTSTPRLAVVGAAVLTVALVAIGLHQVGRLGALAAATPSRPSAGALPAERWSPQRVAELRDQRRPVLVNVTADWCVTCKLNERVALSDRRVAEALRRSGAAYLVADWTLRDPAVATALAEHGRAGVPLYLVYGRDGRIRTLPQLLSADDVVEALEAGS